MRVNLGSYLRMYFKNELFGLARVRINEVPISEGLLYQEIQWNLYITATVAKVTYVQVVAIHRLGIIQ